MPAAPPPAPALAFRSIRRLIAALLTTVILAAVAACGTGTGSAGPAPLAGTHVAVAVVPITDAAPFMLAVQRGYFTRAGLHVTYTITAQSTAAAADLVHGSVNVIAAANYVSFFAAQAHGAMNIKVLAANSQCGTGTQAVPALPGSGITKPADLAGKTIAVNVSPNIQTLTITRQLQALTHLWALAASGDDHVAAVAGDLGRPAAILDAVQATGLTGLTEPACLILAMVLHFTDAPAARDLVAAYISGLAPGSHVIITVGCGDRAIGAQITRTYDAARVYNHPPEDVASFFAGLDLISPGIADARAWMPGWSAPARSRNAPGRCWPGSASNHDRAAAGHPGMAGFQLGRRVPDPLCPDQWAALRRDTRRFLTAATLDGLRIAIEADYAASPIPRDADLPGTADYLNAPGEDEDEDDAPDEDENGGGAPGRDRERLELLIRMRETFPQWAISYVPFSRTWTACKDGATICQKSAALLCTALALIEKKERRARHGPGRDWPPGDNTSP